VLICFMSNNVRNTSLYCTVLPLMYILGCISYVLYCANMSTDCTVLFCTLLYLLHYTLLFCTVLYYTALSCTILYSTNMSTDCSVLSFYVLLLSVPVLYCTVLCGRVCNKTKQTKANQIKTISTFSIT